MKHPGKRIAELRKQIGLTQGGLAEKCDCSRAYLARIETESQEPSLSFMNKVADAIGVPTGLLLLDEGDLPADHPMSDLLVSMRDNLIALGVVVKEPV